MVTEPSAKRMLWAVKLVMNILAKARISYKRGIATRQIPELHGCDLRVTKTIAIVGGGPAGLTAAEILAGAGFAVTVYDAMPSVGRKFLMAGKGGLNLTHNEPLERFQKRFGARQDRLAPLVRAFNPSALRAWVYQ